jgi:putative transposase
MLLAEYRVSERRACATVYLHRSVYRYLDRPRDDRAVRQRMKEIAKTRVRYGFARIHILLRVRAGATITSALTGFTRKKG